MNHISCIVVCHNEGYLLSPTLKSVKISADYARRNGLDVDIHVVLDNADVKTIYCAKSNTEDAAILHEVSYGDLALSRNHAVSKSTSEFIAFVDGDDLWCESWIYDAYLVACSDKRNCVYHPEFNFIFGNDEEHVFIHVDMEDSDYEPAALLRSNYWTALSFARRDHYLSLPFDENRLQDGFGYEDWTWNYKMIEKGFLHKTVRGTSHFIRRKPKGASLLSKTNSISALPSFLPIYRDRQKQTA